MSKLRQYLDQLPYVDVNQIIYAKYHNLKVDALKTQIKIFRDYSYQLKAKGKNTQTLDTLIDEFETLVSKLRYVKDLPEGATPTEENYIYHTDVNDVNACLRKILEIDKEIKRLLEG